MRELFSALLILGVALLTVSCEGASPVAPGELSSISALTAALHQQGATVVRGEMLPRESNPFFSTNAQVVVVNSGHVNVFEYPTVGAAESDAAKVSPNGSVVGNVAITWVGPPHFYKSGRLIVIYAGRDDAVLRPLEAVLGQPFAH